MPTILVVDDEPIVNLMGMVLRECGYDVLEFHNPVDAASFCAESGQRIDLVVSDVDLPGLNGLQLAERLQEEQPHLKFIFTSGNPASCERVRTKGYRCLAKPFSLAELREAIHQCYP